MITAVIIVGIVVAALYLRSLRAKRMAVNRKGDLVMLDEHEHAISE